MKSRLLENAYGISLAHGKDMIRRTGFLSGALLMISLAACTGGQETTAQQTDGTTTESSQVAPKIEPSQVLAQLSPSIPLYSGAHYRDDLTRRDSVMLRNQFGADAKVYTLASDDSFPQVWHYYVTYLAQYRGYQPPSPYPPENQEWRTIQVNLTQAMNDPFIPDDNLPPGDRTVILQVAETESDPRTLIRYIVQPTPASTVATTTGAAAATPGAVEAAPAAPGESEEQ